MPEFLIAKYPIPFYLGGTSILIVVVVAMDTVTQVQTRLMSSQYESLIKKTKFDLRLGKMSRKKIIEFTQYDKKNLKGKVRYTLPQTIGNAKFDVVVGEEVVAKVLGEMK